jgi:hypothetical protein
MNSGCWVLQSQPLTSGTTNVDVSMLSDGLYTIMLKTAGTITSQKLVIIR